MRSTLIRNMKCAISLSAICLECWFSSEVACISHPETPPAIFLWGRSRDSISRPPGLPNATKLSVRAIVTRGREVDWGWIVSVGHYGPPQGRVTTAFLTYSILMQREALTSSHWCHSLHYWGSPSTGEDPKRKKTPVGPCCSSPFQVEC